jgi:hypothetical protein
VEVTVAQPYSEGEAQIMLSRIKVMDIDLDHPLTDIDGLDGYAALQGLVRLHQTPIGYVKVAVTGGRCAATTLRAAIVERHHQAIIRHLLADGLATPQRDGAEIIDWLNASHAVYSGPLPVVTVAVCTRDRPAQLAHCLPSLCQLDYPALDLLVIDNAPSNPATAHLVRSGYPQVRYVCEPRPGLNWARNRAIAEARGEIIAYTDDDVVVDRGWVRALAEVFAAEAEVMAVTGLVVPLSWRPRRSASLSSTAALGVASTAAGFASTVRAVSAPPLVTAARVDSAPAPIWPIAAVCSRASAASIRPWTWARSPMGAATSRCSSAC